MNKILQQLRNDEYRGFDIGIKEWDVNRGNSLATIVAQGGAHSLALDLLYESNLNQRDGLWDQSIEPYTLGINGVGLAKAMVELGFAERSGPTYTFMFDGPEISGSLSASSILAGYVNNPDLAILRGLCWQKTFLPDYETKSRINPLVVSSALGITPEEQVRHVFIPLYKFGLVSVNRMAGSVLGETDALSRGMVYLNPSGEQYIQSKLPEIGTWIN